MSIQEQILSDLKQAMKDKDQDRLRVLRSLKAKMLEKEISVREGGQKKELSDEHAVEVLMKAAKQRRESIEQYEKGSRDDLAAQEKQELEVIESYLPEMMSEDEIREIIREKIKEVGAESMADMGPVMGSVMPEVKGKAEGSEVKKVVQEELSG